MERQNHLRKQSATRKFVMIRAPPAILVVPMVSARFCLFFDPLPAHVMNRETWAQAWKWTEFERKVNPLMRIRTPGRISRPSATSAGWLAATLSFSPTAPERKRKTPRFILTQDFMPKHVLTPIRIPRRFVYHGMTGGRARNDMMADAESDDAQRDEIVGPTILPGTSETHGGWRPNPKFLSHGGL